MKTWFILIYFIAYGLAYAEEASKRPVLPAEWEASIDIQSLEEWSREALKTEAGDIPQQALNRYLQVVADLWNAKLMLTFVELSGRLSDTEKQLLSKEQAVWLRERQKKSELASKEDGGSSAGASYSSFYIQATKLRLEKLATRLDRVRKPK